MCSKVCASVLVHGESVCSQVCVRVRRCVSERVRRHVCVSVWVQRYACVSVFKGCVCVCVCSTCVCESVFKAKAVDTVICMLRWRGSNKRG